MISKTYFNVGKEKLSGQTVFNPAGDKPQLLFLHGAGQATKERALPIAERLAELSISSFGFDFSGHGESTGQLSQSSLKKRTDEALAAYQFLDQTKPKAICAFSMAGHIALELLKRTQNIQALFLFYPAIYSDKAFNLNFDSQFSAAIREENSWQKASVVNCLKDFKGNLLIVIGENDQVIPKGVVELLDEIAVNTKNKKIITVPEVGHLVLPAIYNNPTLSGQIIKIMYEYIND